LFAALGRLIEFPTIFAAQQGHSKQIMAVRKPDRTPHFLPRIPAPLSWRCEFKSRRPLPHHAAPPDKRPADTSLPAPSARTTQRPQSPRWRNARRRRGRRYRRRACPYGCPQHRDKGRGRAPVAR